MVYLSATFTDVKVIRDAIIKVVEDVLDEKTRDCFRVKKAIVKGTPSGGLMEVLLVGDSNSLFLPYSSRVSSVTVGSVVWVAVLGNSMRNAIVWETANFR